MATLNVFGPIDQTIENVTRDQLDAVLSEVQPDVRFFMVDIWGQSTQLLIGDPARGSATFKVITADGVERTEFDNIPDAISAFRELTAHLL